MKYNADVRSVFSGCVYASALMVLNFFVEERKKKRLENERKENQTLNCDRKTSKVKVYLFIFNEGNINRVLILLAST